jgi:hypothetical protein
MNFGSQHDSEPKTRNFKAVGCGLNDNTLTKRFSNALLSSFISGSKKQPLRAVVPLYPPALSPPPKPGGERGPSGEKIQDPDFRPQASGHRGTAKQPGEIEVDYLS